MSFDPDTSTDLRHAGADLLKVTLRQLRAWDEEAARQRAAQAKPDDAAPQRTEQDTPGTPR